MEEEIIYPYFIPCSTEEWTTWNQAATNLLVSRYGSKGGNNYSDPFRDADKQCYFIVNADIEEVVPEARRAGFYYDQINWPDA